MDDSERSLRSDMSCRPLYAFGLVVCALGIMGGAAVIGVGLSYVRDFRSWQSVRCAEVAESPLDSAFIANISNGECYVVTLNVNANNTLYLSDPVRSYAEALSQLAALVPRFATWNASGCLQRQQTNLLAYPAACSACHLTCVPDSRGTIEVPLYLESQRLQNQLRTGNLLISIGAPVSGGMIVAFVVFVTLYQVLVDQKRAEAIQRAATAQALDELQ